MIEIRKQVKQKGKRNIEDIYQTPEPSSEEEKVLSESLIHLKKQSTKAKEKGKERQRIEKGNKIQGLRRSSKIKGKLKKMQIKGAHFIDLGGETPDQSLENTPSNKSPQYSPSPQLYFETSPRKTTPEIDQTQQQMYDLIESLEKTTTEQGTSSNQPGTTQETLIHLLKQ